MHADMRNEPDGDLSDDDGISTLCWWDDGASKIPLSPFEEKLLLRINDLNDEIYRLRQENERHLERIEDLLKAQLEEQRHARTNFLTFAWVILIGLLVIWRA